MDATPHPTSTAEHLCQGVAATLRAARALAASGRQVDLIGLDNMIGHLCAQILDLPADDARDFRGQLQAIDHEIEQLRQMLAESG